MKLILLGAPGAGKGTQATRISDKYNWPHISTGDILRKNIKENTELGKEAKSYIDAGLLVPDEVVINIVKDRLAQADCKNGYILDGFPRTVAQAEALDKVAEIDAVINIAVDSSLIVNRITGRRMCACGESYHISMGIGETCPKCGAKLYQRDDDKEETVKARMQVYENQTAPLIDYYNAKGLVIDVDGSKPLNEVFEQISKVIDDNNKK
ncbi:MAG: adenylate kinase [Clostridia bacterium]|nr:adenylate kinase [Clostridia bacterium]